MNQTNTCYIEAPLYYPNTTIFLAGGITDCPDWQSEITQVLRNNFTKEPIAIAIFNPRRNDFPIDDPLAAELQIKWEYEHLRIAEYILFWFPAETLCPIVLYELGFWITSNKKIFIGIDPTYRRKQDVEIQTRLIRPELKIVYSTASLCDQIIQDIKNCY